MTDRVHEPRRPSYRQTRGLLLRGMGLAYLSAFGSLAVQVDGLIGERGILPAAELFGQARQVLGASLTRFWLVPSLLWIDASDRMLHFLCWGGVVLAAALTVGLLPGVVAGLLWVFYLSLVVAGQVFLGYQWDSLLLEAGFLAILLAPGSLWLARARDEPWPWSIWLVRWLVFRLMFLSGLVKLTSGDPVWWAWQALEHHYQTQPLPTWTSWYIHQLPPGFHWLSVGFMFFVELITPFFVLGPRPIRVAGFVSLVLLQVLIAATGNYGFFNVLTIVLCLSWLDDRDWGWLKGRVTRFRSRVSSPPATGEDVVLRPWSLPRRFVTAAVGMVLVLATAAQMLEAAWPAAPIPGELFVLQNALAPLRIANTYGLFAVMSTRRPEITIEGSEDGSSWRPYRFRWKPCELDRRPRFAPFHLPRLDWQMWFAALGGNCVGQPWFLRFEQRLLEGSPPVLALLRDDPFPGGRPGSSGHGSKTIGSRDGARGTGGSAASSARSARRSRWTCLNPARGGE